jgi:cellulose synthase/poly-beta-1,6-N-acetylglucosamine synthase-like glycosyltransferase
MGRGFCRALGLENSIGQYIIMVDATNFIEERFIEKSLQDFYDKSVLAVSGTLRSTKNLSTLNRWRSRHLFKEQSIGNKKVKSHMLITYGTLFSRDALTKIGGFNPTLRFKEDQDLGNRLKQFNLYVIGDPNISIFPSKSNSLYELMERYSRWNMDIHEKPSCIGYLKNIKACIKPMIQLDLQEGDFKSVFISVLVPHFQLFFSIKTFINNKN